MDGFRNLLLGLNKNDAEKVIKDKYSDSIASISFTIRPKWNGSFPSEANRIKIENTIAE